MTPDAELISAYANHRSDDAFRALMSRYVNLVYGACLRQLRDRHLAEDATQGVFVLLSQKAASLHRQSCIAGWLLTTARYACANIRKIQRRRERRELVVAMNQEAESTADAADGAMLAELDEGLRRLGSGDRDALVLRFLQDRPLRDVGVALGVSEDAARKRVDRGLEKLRRHFLRREVVAGESAALAVALVRHAHAVALPAHQTTEIASAVLNICHGGGAAASAAASTIAQQIKMTMLLAHLKTSGLAALVAIILAVGGWFALRPAAAVALAAPAAPTTDTAAATTAPAEAPAPATDAAAALDLSEPLKTLDTFINAVEKGDRTAVYACLTADPTRQPKTALDVLLDATLAHNRCINAITAAFGKGQELRLMVTLDQAGRMFQASNALGGAALETNGDTARMKVQFANSMINMLPADAQPSIRQWNGKGLFFVRDSSKRWRIDMEKSARVVIYLTAQKGNQFRTINDPKRVTEAMLACTAAMDRVSSAIANDQITTYDQAKTGFRMLFWTTLNKFDGANGFTVDVLPVEP